MRRGAGGRRGSRREVVVDLSNRQLSDADVVQIAPALDIELRAAIRAEGRFPGLVLSVQHNQCGDRGVSALCNVLGRLRDQDLAYTKILKVFYNEVSDEGAVAIARLIETHARMAGVERRHQLQECHLSHNAISTEGARALIQQAQRSYPYVDASAVRVPLWLRMDNNAIDAAALAHICPPLCPVAPAPLRPLVRAPARRVPGAGWLPRAPTPLRADARSVRVEVVARARAGRERVGGGRVQLAAVRARAAGAVCAPALPGQAAGAGALAE
jgi:hypothetical protein